MNYVLIEVELNGNADMYSGSDRHYHRATSKSKELLKDYCKEVYGKEVGKPEKFTWENYFLITESPIVILIDEGTTEHNSVSVENCSYYEEGQGRHLCGNLVVKNKRCEGVCKDYKDKRKLK